MQLRCTYVWVGVSRDDELKAVHGIAQTVGYFDNYGIELGTRGLLGL